MGQGGIELRLRGMLAARLAWSASVGLIGQVHVRADEDDELGRRQSEPQIGGGLFPYLVGGLHYFPARSWSLDFGLRGGVAALTRRLPRGVQPATSFSLEYIGGLTWYH
jgi:hypothetical protein